MRARKASRVHAARGRLGRSLVDAPGVASSIELVLEDDRRGLTIHALTIAVTLRLRGRSARASTTHRPEARFGDVAGESLVTHGHRQPRVFCHGLRPRRSRRSHGTFVTTRLE